MTSIFVAKLDFGITSEQLKQAFEEYGTVLKASVATDRETGKSRGFGFVEMSDKEEAMNAIEHLDGSMMNGRPIAVKEAEQRQDNRTPRDSNAPRTEFNRTRGESNTARTPFQRPDSRPNEYKKPGEDDSIPFIPALIDPLKIEPRKKEKEKDKKVKDWGDTEGRAKKPKMNAYKKSGKNNRFFDEDEDDDFDIHALNNYDDDDEGILEEDDDYYADEEEEIED